MASNTFAAELMPRIIANSREYLRRQAAWLSVVNHDFSDASGKIGQKYQIPIPQSLGVQDLQAGQLPPVAAAKNFPVFEGVLDKAKISDPFTVEQIHLQNYQISGPGSVLQQQINAGIDAVIGSVAEDLWSKYYQIPTFVGTAGEEFFRDADDLPSIDRLADVQAQLFAQKNPRSTPKTGIVNFTDWATMGKVQEVRQAYSIGTPQVIQDYQWPSIMGFNLKEDYFLTRHTAGTITGGLVCNGITVAGLKSVVVATDIGQACALKKGDIVTIVTGGVTYQYSLTADLTLGASTTGALLIDRELEVATADTNPVALAANFGTGRMLIFGDMQGASLVTRLPANPQDIPEMPVKLQGEHIPVVDPVTGISVLISFFGQYFQRTMHVSLVWASAINDYRRLVRGLSAA